MGVEGCVGRRAGVNKQLGFGEVKGSNPDPTQLDSRIPIRLPRLNSGFQSGNPPTQSRIPIPEPEEYSHREGGISRGYHPLHNFRNREFKTRIENLSLQSANKTTNKNTCF